MLKLPSYGNQSIDLQNKSVGLFLYDATLGFNELRLGLKLLRILTFLLQQGMIQTKWKVCYS